MARTPHRAWDGRRAVGSALAMSLTVGAALLGVPHSAGAATGPTIVSASRSTSKLVVNSSGQSNYLTITAHVTDPDGVEFVQWFLETGTGLNNGPLGQLTLASGTKNDGVWSTKWRQVGAPVGGTYKVDILAVGTTGISPYKYLGSTSLKRDAVFTLHVDPNPAKAGKALHVWGTLKQVWPATATTVKYRPLLLTRMQIDFRLKGRTTWTKRAVRTTDGGGGFAVVFTAKSDGTWRVTYAGAATIDSASATKFHNVT